ncbi:hypothetical protein [Sphingosinicella sp. BN140058]|uniref:hypothetical protein n=1 Tax=Sphingosinicella sp. BN140058 TaxID=1892855 RepID=UPI001010CC72|nr:hypothetical protein [Sphingosinicella sp. BN140058]QAY76556.1 hypothetical protein ETR14_08640 [Sphingosinicella sp. BN140058]
MANRNFAESTGSATRSDATEWVAESPIFGPIEREVIALGRREAERWLRLPRALVALLGRLLDLADAKPLANPQLEALRRFSVRTRLTGGVPPPDDVERFLSAGFSPVQARALTASSFSAR